MSYELVTDEDYEQFPEEPELKFVELERIARRRMNQIIAESGREDFDELVRNQYMMIVSEAAAELGIEGVKYPAYADRPAFELERFMVQAVGAVTRIQLRHKTSRSGSVRLSAKTRQQIEVQIRRLRTIIEGGDMPEDKRVSLLRRLEELADEVAKTRLNLTKAMAVLAFVSLGVTSGTSFLADAPDAIATITSLIGLDKQAEDDEIKRLGPPPAPRALPSPPSAPSKAPAFVPGGMDDDIPF